MAPLRERNWESGYAFHPFAIGTTEREFRFSRRGPDEGRGLGPKLVPSNLAVAWTPHGEETLIGGVLQGRKQFDPRGASMLCRKRMWRLAAEVAAILAIPALKEALSVENYGLVKGIGLLEARRRIKEEVRGEALMGWVGNEGDEDWRVDEISQSGNQ
jgi:tRNA-specific adenosine deaminase 1